MKQYRIDVRITPREGLLDPQGKAVQHALQSLDFPQVREVNVGRLVSVRLTAESPEAAREAADAMCRQLLANPVTENYRIEPAVEDDGARQTSPGSSADAPAEAASPAGEGSS